MSAARRGGGSGAAPPTPGPNAPSLHCGTPLRQRQPGDPSRSPGLAGAPRNCQRNYLVRAQFGGPEVSSCDSGQPRPWAQEYPGAPPDSEPQGLPLSPPHRGPHPAARWARHSRKVPRGLAEGLERRAGQATTLECVQDPRAGRRPGCRPPSPGPSPEQCVSHIPGAPLGGLCPLAGRQTPAGGPCAGPPRHRPRLCPLG